MTRRGGMRRQLLLTFLTMILLSLAIIGLILGWYFQQNYMDNLEQSLRAEASLLAGLVRDPLSRGRVDQVTDLVSQAGDDLGRRVTVVGEDGTVWADSHENPRLMANHRDRPEIQTASVQGWGGSRRKSATLQVDMFYLAQRITDESGNPRGYLRLAVPLTEVRRSLGQFFLLLGGGSMLAAFVTGLLSFRLARGLTSPVEEITRVAARMAGGDLEQRVQVRASHEMALMRDTVNRMADSLEAQVRELTRAKERMEAILAHNVTGLVLFDGEMRVEMGNPIARDLLGATALRPGAPADQVLRNYEMMQVATRAREKGQTHSREVLLVYPQPCVVAATAVPLGDATRTGGLLLVLQDITELRRLERVRSEFVANVSHELKTPVTAIRGFAETLAEGAAREPAEAEEFSRIILREAERLQRLVDDLLDLTRVESGSGLMQRQLLDLNVMVQDVVGLWQPRVVQEGLELTASLHPGPIRLLGDAHRLQQVLINLLDNAVKHTRSSGRIILQTWLEPGAAVLAVADTGQGIPVEDLPRVFERFFRVDRARSREQGGTGLGLAIVKHIVEAHGGAVSVSSQLGQGSRFEIRLPLAS